ncbi:hypothetical protein RHODOSMS8_03034 [Rhodobiaceae bacterium]|nr:hypothetical protein RHODOSMS8_03034 [Rhodobiaceae bacterium]
MIVTFPALIRLGAIAALLGGTLRFGSSFIPWVEGSVPLETLYFVTDVALLFGLFAIYLARADRMGLLGLVGFVIAAVGQAAIIGPDHVPFGIDVYGVGVQLIVGGLFLLGIDLVRKGAYPAWVAGFWIAVPFVSLGLGVLDPTPYGWGYFLGGILFSLGFSAAGLTLLRTTMPTRR